MSDWRAVFGHATPYENQAAGIETALSVFGDGGYLALEGACGTGKTMLALTAGLQAVRDRSNPYERVFVVTSVKQQLAQFEADLDRIAEHWPASADPFGAVTLVGKADVCPYHLADTGGMTDDVLYERCENLRDRTRELVEAGRDPSGLAADARPVSGDGFAVADTTAPYPGPMPTAAGPEGVGEVEYCPFYAQYLADRPREGDPTEAIPFDYRGDGPLRPTELVRRGVEAGTCPHSVMGALLQDAEVVVGNYYHAFDDRTVSAFTGPLLDERTIFICDEAHMLESRVRDLASESIALTTIERARDELADVIEYAKGRAGRGEEQVARTGLEEAGVSRSDLSLAHTFLGAVVEAITDLIEAADPTPEETIPLREPTEVTVDRLTDALEEAGYGEGAWLAVQHLGPPIERILNAVDGEERWRATPTAGRFLASWWDCDHESYLRSIELTEREAPGRGSDLRARSRVRLQLDNCVPGDVIADVLSQFGGGILMSATLEPMEIFTEVTGLDRLAAAGQRIETRRFGLPFPQTNRLSLIVDAPKFTYRNRGPPGADTQTRRIHADAIAAVARGPGNALVAMPSYAEATWAAEVLSNRLEKPVLADESSDRETTTALKNTFFAGEGKVLVTSLRGTLTEGVDYPGDRLATAAVVGVPIINTGDAKTEAMQTAYDRRFGDGFEQALVVPAVRKARQALGRVIRGPDEVGVRALIDERYAKRGWDGVADHLPDATEFDRVAPDEVDSRIRDFWTERDNT